ncbi:MAG: type I methionyl aminopeptidase [Elusimicrobiota bacterium]
MFKPVSVELKSPRELAKLRDAGRLVSEVLEFLLERVAPGITTKELDALAERELRRARAEPAFLGYRGYPAVLCASVNDEVVHGIPSGSRVLKEGDIVSLDLGCRWKGFYGDAAVTAPVGAVSDEARRLMDVTRESLEKGISSARPDNRLGDVSAAVQRHVEAAGFSAVREFVGHGIGRALHEDPAVPNVGQPGTGIRLRPGMVLALEPMVNAGGPDVRVLDDGWTAVTKDGSLSAHFEHMVAVTDGEPDILTRRD